MLMCVINLGEVVYKTAREYGQERSQGASALAQALAIEFVDVDRHWRCRQPRSRAFTA